MRRFSALAHLQTIIDIFHCGSRMRRSVIASIMLLAIGCSSVGEQEAEPEELRRLDLLESKRIFGEGDQVIFQGRVTLDGERYAFRPCDRADTYLLIPTMQLEDELTRFTETLYDADAGSIYVRFYGHEAEYEGVIPRTYAGVVEATQYQATISSIPANCD